MAEDLEKQRKVLTLKEEIQAIDKQIAELKEKRAAKVKELSKSSSFFDFSVLNYA